MNTKERNVRENESREKREELLEKEGAVNADLEANRLKAEGRDRFRNGSRKVNRLWLWFGVLVLIAILLYWLFSIGLFEDMVGAING